MGVIKGGVNSASFRGGKAPEETLQYYEGMRAGVLRWFKGDQEQKDLILKQIELEKKEALGQA